MYQTHCFDKLNVFHSQINWIISDSDVHEFYKSLLENHEDKIDKGLAEAIVEEMKLNELEDEN